MTRSAGLPPALALGCLVTLAAPCVAQQDKQPIFYTVQGMERVQVHTGVPYKEADGRPRRLDVYVPPSLAAGARRPAVVLVSGGTSPDVETRTWPGYQSWGRVLAASGFVAVTFTHRLSFPKRRYADGASDLRDTLTFLRTHASAYHIDADRIGVIAYSGGGPMLSVPLKESIPFVRALVGFYPFLTTDHVDRATADTPEDEIRSHSPIRYIRGPATPPILVLRAGRGQIAGVNESIDAFAAAAIAANAPITIANHPEGEHGFDARNDVPRTRELIAQAIAFLDTHLRVRR